MFIGPLLPPLPLPPLVIEAESAEAFEEVTRIMEAEADSPYDVLGVNTKMTPENIMKKRYWKLSLWVHPDKCSHPQAHQAFIILNKAFKELQDPDKRKVLDEKIELKEQQKAKRKRSYLEAYNEATTTLASKENDKKATSEDARLVDEYNKARRSKSLVRKHQEEAASRPKKKAKKGKEDEWADKHPWKPWDREKDIVAGRKKVKLDTDNMAQGLTSRFSSGNFQRSFL